MGFSMPSIWDLQEPDDVLFRLQRGLAGYVSYLAACEMNESFSEYVLYEPILRILTARQFSVECEVEAPGIVQPPKGDRKRIDFVAERNGGRFALEVKWAKSSKLDVKRDHEKLVAFRSDVAGGGRAFLLVFGKESDIKPLSLKPAMRSEVNVIVVAGLKKTRYGCRVFEA
jgi:Holliday junction resolvase